MATSIKEMVVVLVLAAAVFYFAKPIALRFSDAADFRRRRNVWFALTVVFFLSPNFWLYAIVAVPLFVWAGRKDSNPVALYLVLLHVVPPLRVDIPAVGINALFPVDNYRLLSLCVLIPTAWRLRKSRREAGAGTWTSMDVLLLGFGLLQTVLFIPPDLPNHTLLHDSPTNVMRRAFLFFIDVYVLYYVVSRFCSTRRTIIETQAALCLSCAVLAAIGAFETLRHWLLYVDTLTRWTNDPSQGFYTMRGASLRAVVSTGTPLALGYILAIALGFWQYLKSQVNSRAARNAVIVLLWLGLLAAYSRGPWIGAVVIYFCFTALSPRPLSRMFKAAGAAALIAGIVSLTPIGTRIANVLPFMGGSVDISNVDYRSRLAERSWALIEASPVFGDQLAYTKMQDLRQGMGIIDVVNTYVQVALDYGVVGLSLFVGFIAIGVARSYRYSRSVAKSDPDLAVLGVSLVACILGTLLMIENCSFILAYQDIFYVLAGLAMAYVRLERPPARHSPGSAPPAAWRPQ